MERVRGLVGDRIRRALVLTNEAIRTLFTLRDGDEAAADLLREIASKVPANETKVAS